ncbi:MAG: LysM domain-containing protein [Deltaproteobacteria bacterium]|nr:MAG: LysM domain-containing protein [Deltaproteobacteria bacterium]
MALSDTAAKAAIKVIDQFSGALFGAELVKAKLVWYKEVACKSKLGEMEFFLNPSTITVEKEAKLEKDESNQGKAEAKYVMTYPLCVKLGEMWFDTYDDRVSVRSKYIDKLEKLLDYVKETHYLPVCTFVWGQFTQETNLSEEYKFYVTKLTVDYTMFLPDATPVRAKVSLGLEQAFTKDEEARINDKQSPDHAKLYTVRRGDTLQAIAVREYEDAGEWRRIAKTNNIDDPMSLKPGMKLLVPPILK